MQNEVERGDKVWRSIDQRSVEIENDHGRGRRHHGGSVLAPRGTCKAEVNRSRAGSPAAGKRLIGLFLRTKRR
jgi:hypothetical protein